MESQDKQSRFEATMLPHLDAAYNLARWLTRNEHDAEDVVQDAFLRAFKFFGGFRGENSRAWLLTVVRNTAYDWLQKNRRPELAATFDEKIHVIEDEAAHPDVRLLQSSNRDRVRQAMEELPVEFREVVVLRELEEMSYKEIAAVADLPIGTVMSRLARARKLLLQSFTQHQSQEAQNEL